MSGFGGFGGFGQQQQQQQQQQQTTGGFGGFGSSTTPGAGFGSTGSTTFGAPGASTGGGLFGGGGTSGGFGNSGAFGSTSGGAFGTPKPSGFGTQTTTGGGLFGGGTATAGSAGFGGFGATPAATSAGFGGGSSSGGLFGGQKPGFGTTPASQPNPFGAAATSSPFGGGTTGAFGSPATALGAGAGECQGTGSVPFQAFIEKEPNSTTNQQNSFQSITFQTPYMKFSPEELRLADYAQGRRYGNANGQAGAFGNSGFGFGANNPTSSTFGTTAATGGGGLFGGGATSSPFGTSQPAQTGGFGSTATATGGLFGAPKPAVGGLFGSTTPAQPAGGLFGSGGGFGSTATTGGFGQQPSAAGGSSMFGAANQTANKPFSFGTAAPAGSTFGAANTTGTGGFGGGSSLFGNTAQQTPGAFGQQQPAATTAFGGGFGTATQQTGATSLFGNANQQKPAGGLFGAPAAANTGGSLFGNPQQPAANASPFGTSNTQTGGGLFGAAKPLATGGLFGNTTQNQGNTGGIFGGGIGNIQAQNQPQQQNTGGLFGSLGAGNQQKPTLFGAPAQQQGGTGLFGSSTGTQQQGGLFGNNNQQQQQQPQSSLFGGGNSMFGNSQQNQQAFTTSINDNSAFGATTLFNSMGPSQMNNPGPLATPLSNSTNRQKRAAAIPITRLSSASSPRFATPQRKGFGFSYSTYTSPSSASSVASTPGTFNHSTSGGGVSNFNRALSKSVSTSNLRHSYSAQDSILAPGAFTASPSARLFGSTGSVKKLNIQRNLRNDLFSPPNPQSARIPSTPIGSALKKRVSFDANATLNGASNSVEVISSNGDRAPHDSGFPRSRPNINGGKTSDPAPIVEMQQVKNNELAVVQEEASGTVALLADSSPSDNEPREYWMKPTVAEIEQMSRAQRKAVDLTVGRTGVGQIHWDKPVDLTSINPAEIPDGIVDLDIRHATVYPKTMQKPAQGSGLNVPATILMENSYPRKGDPRDVSAARMAKHLRGLKRVVNTSFVSYDQKTGIWIFTVEHFTTYSYPEDDEADGEDESQFGQSTLSAPPDTPTPKMSTLESGQFEESFASTSRTGSDPDDTFEFRKRKILPGAFDNQEVYEEEMDEEYDDEDRESFLDDRSAGSQSESGVEPMDQDDASYDDESVSIVDQEMAGSYPEVGNTVELDEDSQYDEIESVETPGVLVRARMRAVRNSGTPRKFAAGDDWTNALRNTVSPKKQDRVLLKSLVDAHGNDNNLGTSNTPGAQRVVSNDITNSIDLMHSLFGSNHSAVKNARVSAKKKDSGPTHATRNKNGERVGNPNAESTLHESLKPSWGPDGTLVYAAPANAKSFGRTSRRNRERDGILNIQKGAIVSERRDVCFAKFSNEAAADHLSKQKSLTSIEMSGDVPYAILPDAVSFSDFVDERSPRDPAAAHEKLVWQLASILWDDVVIPDNFMDGPSVTTRLRKEKLSAFWQNLVSDASSRSVALARSNEEKAIALLAGFKVADSCAQLVQGRDFHLATLVSLIGVKDSMRQDIREQLKEWQKSQMLSEFSQPVRAIYELLSGNVCVCEGSTGAAVEDRVDSFIISKRFGLDWRQAFGLRLWYGTLTQDPFANAVEAFAQDLAQGKETCNPAAWYIEQKIPSLWTDEAASDREDLLWGLLKLSTFHDADIESILRPENSQLSPLDMRLSWQLAQMLFSSGVVRLAVEGEEKADQITIAFASQLTNEGSWLDAVFVLLHVLSEEARSKSLQEHIAHHAGLIGSVDSDVFKILAEKYKIPAPWIWDAKALYLRSVEKDYRAEVECLINAGSFNEAHKTFAQEVAPKTIIEMDYDALRSLLRGFEGHEDSIAEWRLGGEIYQDFLELHNCQKRSQSVDPTVLDRLMVGPPAVVEKSRKPSFMERVAMETISAAVAKTVVSMSKTDETVRLNKVLRLPLTEDKYLKHTIGLSLEYYRGIMASGR